MRLWIRAFVLGVLLIPIFVSAPVHAESPSCQYTLGFETLHDLLPAEIGPCLDNEAYNSIGDGIQHTADGMLVWRKADNWTAFTDGFRTWINGPYGLQMRLNSERFPWEHLAVPAAVVQATPAASVVQSSSVTATSHCSAVASSGSAQAVGLGTVTTSITGSGGDTTVVTNNSTSSSTPGVATTGC